MERREAGVAAAGAVAPLPLEMIEELAEERRVEVCERELGWGAAQACGGEAQQQAERVAVGDHGVRAGRALAQQPFGEERLQQPGEVGAAHGRSSDGRVARSVARRRSSGTASMYQYVSATWACPR